MSLRLLVTAAGTGTGFGYAMAAARDFPDIKLVTGDIHEASRVTASAFSVRHLQLPPCADPGYFEHLDQVLEVERVDAYLPLIDLEVLAAAERAGHMRATIASNSAAFCRAAIAKSGYARWLPQVVGTAAIAPVPVEQLRGGNRLVAKRDGGFGGRSTREVREQSEARALLEQGWSLYPFIDGDEFTIDCFPLAEGAVVSVRQRLETRAGVCVKARIAFDPVLQALAQALCQTFGLTEPFCFQTRRRDGIHHVIDINPRLGAGTSMSAPNGTDFFAAHLARISGRDPREHLVPRFAECVVSRQYTDYLMSASA